MRGYLPACLTVLIVCPVRELPIDVWISASAENYIRTPPRVSASPFRRVGVTILAVFKRLRSRQSAVFDKCDIILRYLLDYFMLIGVL